MNFLAPAAFALSLLLPLIVALYLLKLRRTEREVSSTYLWRKMVRDMEANAPWQRLRRNLLLILQLLFLLVLIFALARPFTLVQGVGGEALILILDTSASMSATDVAPNRLEAAKQRARQLVDDMLDDARITVISAGTEAQVRVAATQDRRQAHLAIASIQPEMGGSELGVALELASAIAARQPDTEIVVLSDGRVTLPERLALKGRLTYLPVGIDGQNQAISQLTLEKAPGSGALTAFAQIANYGAQPAQNRLLLYANGALLNAYDLELPARGQQAVVVEDLPPDTVQIEARLAEEDMLPLDNQAVAVLTGGSGSISVALVSPGNRFLETAISLFPGAELTRVDTRVLAEEQAENDAASGPLIPEADLTIFDGYVPGEDELPDGNLLFIAPVSSTEMFTTTGTIETPVLNAANVDDPLLSHVSLTGINVLDAVSIPLPDWARPVIMGESAEGSSPLLFVGEVDGRRVAVLAFDLRRSDLPLNMAFPLLWANLFQWLVPGSSGGIPQQVNPGETISFLPPVEGEAVTVTRPDGSVVRLNMDAGRLVFADTTELGVYRVSWGESGSAAFVVNLFSNQESLIEPAASLPGPAAEGSGEGTQDQLARREWWRPFALLSLAVLTGEWFVYQRAALVRLRDDASRFLERFRR